MVNRAILIGRLGRDPETREISAGQHVCNLSLATEETFKDRNGERQKRTEWHRVAAWGKLAEIAEKHLHKGSLVYVEGKIQSCEWEKDGEKRTSFEIVANSLRILGAGKTAKPEPSDEGKSGRKSDARRKSERLRSEGALGEEPEELEPEITDADIPF